MANQLKLPEDTELAKQIINNNNEKEKRDLGTLGRLFGSSSNAPTNIIGVITFTLIIVGIIYTFIPDTWKSCSTYQFWTLILPVITSMIGYFFGVNGKNKN